VGEASRGTRDACDWGSDSYSEAHGRQNRAQEGTQVRNVGVGVVVCVALEVEWSTTCKMNSR
jgi:hypothetical protein